MRRHFTPPVLSGRAAVVTGGGSGLGRAFALALVDAGARVWIVGRRSLALEETASLRSGQMHTFVGDVADTGAMESLAATVSAATGGELSVLVNNAGVLGPRAPLTDYPQAEFEEVFRVNVFGVSIVTRALLPLLRKAAPGSTIVSLSSGVGRMGRAQWGAYAGSKFAVEGLTQVWADELRDAGVAVHALNPGATRTAMRAEAKPDEDPLTLPAPADIVPSLLYLLSAEASGPERTGQSVDARDFMEAG